MGRSAWISLLAMIIFSAALMGLALLVPNPSGIWAAPLSFQRASPTQEAATFRERRSRLYLSGTSFNLERGGQMGVPFHFGVQGASLTLEPTSAPPPSPRESAQPRLPTSAAPDPIAEAATRLGLYVISFLSLLSLSLLTLYLFPQRLRYIRDALVGGWWSWLQVGLVGLLGYVLAFALSLLLAFLFVGIPLAFFLLFTLGLVSLLGLVGVSLALGRGILFLARSREAPPLLEGILGLLAMVPFVYLPMVGWPVLGIALILGLGAVLVTKFGSGESWSLEALRWEGPPHL